MLRLWVRQALAGQIENEPKMAFILIYPIAHLMEASDVPRHSTVPALRVREDNVPQLMTWSHEVRLKAESRINSNPNPKMSIFLSSCVT